MKKKKKDKLSLLADIITKEHETKEYKRLCYLQDEVSRLQAEVARKEAECKLSNVPKITIL